MTRSQTPALRVAVAQPMCLQWVVDSTGELAVLIPGSFVFEHLHPRVVVATIHPQTPRVAGK